jgi:hypothetical protein
MLHIDDLLLDFGAWGFRSQRQWLNTRVALNSGHERRNAERTRPRMLYKAPYDRIHQAHAEQLSDSFDVCMGSNRNFRFRDKQDFEAIAVTLGAAAGGVDETMQLIKPASFGALGYNRIIKFPADSTKYTVANGYHHDARAFEVTEDTGGGPLPLAATVDYLTGIVTFTATPAAIIRASYEYHVPVHFDDDTLDLVFTTYKRHSVEITVIEDFGA